MNESNQNHEPTTTADLQDRLVDRALVETVGGEVPPDFTARIMANVARQSASTERLLSHSRRWALAIAASLILAATVAISQFGTLSNSVARVDGRMKSQSVQRTSSSPQYKSQMKIKDRSVALVTTSESLPANAKRNAIGLDGLIDDAKGPWESGEKGGRSKDAREMKLVAQVANAPPKPGDTDYEPMMMDVEASQPAMPQPASQSTKGDVYLGYLWTADAPAAGAPAGDLLASTTGRRPGLSVDNWNLGLQRGGAALQTPSSVLADGSGPQSRGDQYTRIYENPFVKAVGGNAVSTFSIDVDTASYANVRQFLMDMRQLPPPDAVRIEELVNYFPYDYAGPAADDKAPFAAHVEVAACPWAPEHRLVRIGIKGREIARDKRQPSNLVFLVDVSGSMDEPNKLPLVVDGLRQLTRELGENDRVAIVVYASSEGLALESTRGDKQQLILAALDRLQAGGSTAGGAGIQLAYQIAEDHFLPGGTNRVVLCTDGDFNVGVTSTAELERLVTEKAKDTKVFLSVLGFGRGNLNDAMMQTIADRGNGNHHYVDNLREARKVLVEEMTGTLITIAKDVKIQVEFNPAQAAGYRLLGYENRLLRTEDFNDDTKDAGEIGAGHTVTALYEVIPAGKPVAVPAADELKYQSPENVGRTILSVDEQPADAANARNEVTDRIVHPTEAVSGELLTLKMRYKEPEGDTSRKLEWPVIDAGTSFREAGDDFRFAAAVASFGLELRGSEYRGTASLDATAEIAQSSLGRDEGGYRTEFIELLRRAKELASQR